jgi:bifunctional ADP-heptose synthase (sugar kinase/adenylyltransferase)
VGVVDKVGAGDSLTAALAIGLLRGDTHRDALDQACPTAGTVCTHAGAVPTPDAELPTPGTVAPRMGTIQNSSLRRCVKGTEQIGAALSSLEIGYHQPLHKSAATAMPL